MAAGLRDLKGRAKGFLGRIGASIGEAIPGARQARRGRRVGVADQLRPWIQGLIPEGGNRPLIIPFFGWRRPRPQAKDN